VLISLRQKNYKTQTARTKKVPKTLLYEKAAHEMLEKLIKGVNFINILCTIFWQIFWRQKISKPKHSFVIFGVKIMPQNESIKC
jgi:hypothetical protein